MSIGQLIIYCLCGKNVKRNRATFILWATKTFCWCNSSYSNIC